MYPGQYVGWQLHDGAVDLVTKRRYLGWSEVIVEEDLK